MNKVASTIKKQWPEYVLEVLVITIGIIGAFTLNRWNDRVELRKQERQIIYQLKSDLESNLNDLQGDFTILRQGLLSHENVESYLASNTDYRDSMCFDFYWMARDEYTYPVGNSYRLLQNIGLDILQDDTLKSYVTYVFEDLYPRISKTSSFYPDIHSYLSDYLHSNFRVNRDTSLIFTLKFDFGELTWPIFEDRFGVEVDQIIGYHPLDFEALKKDESFKMMINDTKEYRFIKLLR